MSPDDLAQVVAERAREMEVAMALGPRRRRPEITAPEEVDPKRVQQGDALTLLDPDGHSVRVRLVESTVGLRAWYARVYLCAQSLLGQALLGQTVGHEASVGEEGECWKLIGLEKACGV